MQDVNYCFTKSSFFFFPHNQKSWCSYNEWEKPKWCFFYTINIVIPLIYGSYCWPQAFFQNDTVWATVPTPVQCVLEWFLLSWWDPRQNLSHRRSSKNHQIQISGHIASRTDRPSGQKFSSGLHGPEDPVSEPTNKMERLLGYGRGNKMDADGTGPVCLTPGRGSFPAENVLQLIW